MVQALQDLLSSKKALVAFLAFGMWVVGSKWLGMTQAQLAEMLAPFWAYIIGQGIADNGKEAAKVTAAAGTPPVRVMADVVETKAGTP